MKARPTDVVRSGGRRDRKDAPRLVLSPMRSSPGGPTAVFVAGRIAAPDRRSKFRRRSGPGCGREPLTGRGDSGSVHAARGGRRLRFAADRRRPAAYLDAAVSAPEDPVSPACRRDGQDDEKVVSLAGSMADARTAPLTRRLRRARRPHLHLSGHTHSPSRIRPLSNERSDDDRRHIRAGTVGQKRVLMALGFAANLAVAYLTYRLLTS